jgi:hypothetical protein
LSLSRQFAMSRRQAYRYVEEAQSMLRPVPIAEPTMAVTFKLAPSLVDAVRARATTERTTISDMVSRALRAFLGKRGKTPGGPLVSGHLGFCCVTLTRGNGRVFSRESIYDSMDGCRRPMILMVFLPAL